MGIANIIIKDRSTGEVVDQRLNESNIIFDAGRVSLIMRNMLYYNSDNRIFLSEYDIRDGFFDYWSSAVINGTIKNELPCTSLTNSVLNQDTNLYDLQAGPFTTGTSYTLRVVGLKFDGSTIVSAIDLSSPIVFNPLFDLYIYYRFVIGLDPELPYYNVQSTVNWDNPGNYRGWSAINGTSQNKKWWDRINLPISTKQPITQDYQLVQTKISVPVIRAEILSLSGYYKDNNSQIEVAAYKNSSVSRVFAHAAGSNKLFFDSTLPQSIGKIDVVYTPPSDSYIPIAYKLNWAVPGSLGVAQYNLTSYPGQTTEDYFNSQPTTLGWPGKQIMYAANSLTYCMFPFVSPNRKYMLLNTAVKQYTVVDTLSSTTDIVDLGGTHQTISDIGYLNCKSIVVDNSGTVWWIKNDELSKIYRQEMYHEESAVDTASKYRSSFDFSPDFPSDDVQMRLLQVDEDNNLYAISNRGIFKVFSSSVNNQPYSVPPGWRGHIYHEDGVDPEWTYELLDETVGGFGENLDRADFEPSTYYAPSSNTLNKVCWTFLVKGARVSWITQSRRKLIYVDLNTIDPAIERIYGIDQEGIDLHAELGLVVSYSSLRLELLNPATGWTIEYFKVIKDMHAISFSGNYLHYRSTMAESGYNYVFGSVTNQSSYRYSLVSSTEESINWSYVYNAGSAFYNELPPNRPLIEGTETVNIGLVGSSSTLQILAGPVPYGWDAINYKWVQSLTTSRTVPANDVDLPNGLSIAFDDSSSEWVAGEYYSFATHPRGVWIDNQQEVSHQDYIYAGYYKIVSELHIIPSIAPYTVEVSKTSHPSWMRMNDQVDCTATRILVDATGRSEEPLMHPGDTGLLGIEGFRKTTGITNGKYEYFCDQNGVFTFDQRDAGRGVDIRYLWVARLP